MKTHPRAVKQLGRPVDAAGRARRRRQIIDAARRCFARRGFDASTTAQISAEAGISQASLFQYFRTKDDLVMALIEENLSADIELIRALENSASLREGLRIVGERLAADHSSSELHALRLDILATTFRRPAVAQKARETEEKMIDALASVIEKAGSSGEVARDLDPRATAALIIAFTDGVLARFAIHGERSHALASSYVEFVARTLGFPS